MKPVRYFLAAAALLAAAACSRADGITSPSSAAPRMNGANVPEPGAGGVTSTGTGTPLPPAPGDTTGNGSVDRGGYMGSGG
jgi:hypothetical protein